MGVLDWMSAKHGTIREGGNKMQHQEFEQRLEELREVITAGIGYFTAFQGLLVEDDDSVHALNRHRGFFLLARESLRWMALLQFNKAFEPDPRTVSLRVLLVAAEKNREALTPYATEENLQELRKQIDDNEDLLQRLKDTRDQRIAHHDAISTRDGVRYGEMRKLVEDVKSMYDSLTRYHSRSTISFERVIRTSQVDTSEVVRLMREDRDRSLRRFKE
jgi:hypothetical protein